MDKVTIIPFRGIDIHILYKSKQLGYSFKYVKQGETEEKAYGQKVTLQGKSIADIVSATFLLMVSVDETITALQLGDAGLIVDKLK